MKGLGWYIGIAAVLVIVVAVWLMGPGFINRTLTIGGIYTVCKPNGYDVVCFGDKAGKEGGIFCLPLQLAGGKCL